MRTIIVGYGNQGRKRYAVAKPDVVAIVDPAHPADCPFVPHFAVGCVPLDSYDAAIVCTPTNAAKIHIVKWLLAAGKHVLVEKPLWPATADEILELEQIAKANGVVCYVAYNHRFEPAIGYAAANVHQLGQIYHVRMFYGNGTAELVKTSWRNDIPLGVIPEVGSHLFDLYQFFGFGQLKEANAIASGSVCTHDHASIMLYEGKSNRDPIIQLEMTYLSWKNTFTIDMLGEKGSLHIDGLTKWGGSALSLRERVKPAGPPIETIMAWVQPDPTWAAEWVTFNKLVYPRMLGELNNTNLSTDRWMAELFTQWQQEEDNASGLRGRDAPGADLEGGYRDTGHLDLQGGKGGGRFADKIGSNGGPGLRNA